MSLSLYFNFSWKYFLILGLKELMKFAYFKLSGGLHQALGPT